MKIVRRGQYWAVYADDGELVCLTVYKKGAQEVVRRLEAKRETQETEQLIGAISPRRKKP